MTDLPTQDIFKLVLVRSVLTAEGVHPSLMHLCWTLKQASDAVVQVYVDGELQQLARAVTPQGLWLVLDRSMPHVVQLLAVAASEAEKPHPAWIEHDGIWRSRAEVSLLRDEQLPVDTRVEVRLNDRVVTNQPLWDGATHRGGFGSLFGLGGFGLDAATGPGLGRGQLGHGPLGVDGHAWQWQSPPLAAGEHDLQIDLLHPDGKPLRQTLTQTFHSDLPGVESFIPAIDTHGDLNW